MLIKLIETNEDLKEQIIELASQPKTINNTNNNNSFNLNNFLNVQCKDAMNLSEFIDDIQITFNDLLYLGNHGFVESVKDTFVKQLKNMEQTKRPIHCTDQKRKACVVKDNNKWEKDNDHEMLFNAVQQINNKQLRAFSKHAKERDPEYLATDANQITNSNMIIQMCSYNDENKEKIHRDIVKQIVSNTPIHK